ncbi:MAG TPA: exodeoxyribonuclease VII large subunit [Candidatus Kapabacteria bacterium]|nr:exodeoxyribonuclease VII large subunit [Candidatus Kapabacteria bacterium]
MQAVTVSQLTGRLRSVLEYDFKDVLIEGEISSFKTHTSGHRYFVLKDEGASLNCTFWRHRRLFFTPHDGMKVLARGAITVYEPRGQYQLDVIDLQPLGEGELQLAFERLKRRLAEEGLFDEDHKKPLPKFPETIGVVTSPTGAALHDIIATIRRRNPSVKVILRPALVQGDGAAADIAAAIKEFNQYKAVDALIVGRGGGSIEDLWAFNEEAVARAIYRSAIPIISAVGHEIDFTIADFVADARAATPTAAAELLVPSRTELIAHLHNIYYFFNSSVQQTVREYRNNIESMLSGGAFRMPFHMVNRYTQSVDAAGHSLGQSVTHNVVIARQKIDNLEQQLSALHPEKVLRRGYAIVRKDNVIVSRASALDAGDAVNIEFADAVHDAAITK